MTIRINKHERVPGRTAVRSFFQRNYFWEGRVSVEDPCGILRGKIYRLWFRPLRVSIEFDFRSTVTQ